MKQVLGSQEPFSICLLGLLALLTTSQSLLLHCLPRDNQGGRKGGEGGRLAKKNKTRTDAIAPPTTDQSMCLLACD